MLNRLVQRLLAHPGLRRAALAALPAQDDRADRLLAPAAAYPRDRYDSDRSAVFADALEAWRVNPLARRVVELTTQYVVGAGITVESPHPAAHQFLARWWQHRLNRMPSRVFEWCDELSRTGNLFVLLSTDAAGMSYLRAIPAADIEAIHVQPNDPEQELAVFEKPLPGDLEARRWPVYDPESDAPLADGAWPTVALHYAVNKPVGALWGESDLAPLLRWLGRYSAWLENRARLNQFRNSFIYVVTGKYLNQGERAARFQELNAQPPSPGTILVGDDSEKWSVLHPQLASHEAGEDGLALKKMIAAGSGNPLHFLAEPESATRTTAEAAGGPTFRRYEQRQQYFLWLVADLARAALARRARMDREVPAWAEVAVKGADISSRDNAALSVAAATVVSAWGTLRDRRLIDDREFLRVAYRFAGEVVDVEAMLRRAASAPPPTAPARSARRPAVSIDGQTGEPEDPDLR